MRQIAVTAHKKVEVIEAPDTNPLKPSDVRGRTIVSLTSPGTELNAHYLAIDKFPHFVGYSCVFEVEETCPTVKDLPKGTLVLASGPHREYQRVPRQDIVPLPPGLSPEKAVFARLAGVSMSTLNTTTARPPARVLITGLGPVGNLAAQIFSACGYRVTAIDPVESRRERARLLGIKDVRVSVSSDLANLVGTIALHVECSGHEQAVLDGCRCVRKRGEVVLLGVPWSRKTEIHAFDIFHAVFHRYIVLRSGWEWELPRQPQDFAGNSIMENQAAALEWLADGRLKVEGMAQCYPPSDAARVYDGLLNQTLPTPAALFDWRLK